MQTNIETMKKFSIQVKRSHIVNFMYRFCKVFRNFALHIMAAAFAVMYGALLADSDSTLAAGAIIALVALLVNLDRIDKGEFE